MQAHVTPRTYSAPSAYCPQRLGNALTHGIQQLGSALVRALAPQEALHIQVCDRDGQPLWTVSDRVTGAHYQFISEAALRTWLEERYSQ